MNKKLLFAAVSLAALTACSTDDFESQNIAAEKTSPVQFEVINNNDSFTRAYMDGSNIHWEASKGDLFTLYHGGTVTASGDPLTEYQNATYTAVEGAGAATLTTPSMIKAGKAIMVWPVDTTFTNKGGEAAVAISIPATLDNIENNITYASDLVDITEDAFATNAQTAAYNKSGYNRKYPVYMRPLTSQLTLKADYAGTGGKIEALYEGADPIDPIKVTSVDLTNTDAKFTQKIALKFNVAAPADITRWGGDDRVNAWSHITDFGTVPTGGNVNKLTTKVLTGNESAKFLILPKSVADDNTAVVVNTTYGKVTTASYTADEKAKAWYKTKGEETTVKDGMSAVFTAIDGAKVNANTVVKGEPVGASATRYVKVLLNHIDMAGLHVTSDKQLYDAVRVWKEIGAPTLTVNLDGDAKTGEFEISQKTIAKINEINAAAGAEDEPRSFSVQPCKEPGEACTTIVITGGGEIAADLTFIKDNDDTKADIALKAGENWKWAASTVKSTKAFKVANTDCGISKIINRGTLVSDATATIAIYNNAADPALVTTIGFVNNGTWNITAGELNVKFNVTNNGTVNISKGAQYRQDASTFTNEATTLPERFFTAKEKEDNKKEQIGKVENKGVFAIVNTGVINNYGLIEHADVDAKTYITANQSEAATFANAFNDKATMVTSSDDNKLGRINLPYSNRKENQLSIKNTTANGFVSVTVSTEAGSAPTGGKLDLTELGDYVNFCIINSGVTEVTKASAKVKYLEFNAGSTEIEINTDFKEIAATATSPAIDARLTGLIVLSPITIIRDKVVVATATYLGANLYKAGAFTCEDFEAYFGNTTSNKDTKIITWGH